MNVLRMILAPIFAVVLHGNAFAQKALPIDYFKTLSMNYNEQKSYLSNLGLTNKGVTKQDGVFECSWSFKRIKIDTTKAECLYLIYLQGDNPKNLSFQTYDKDDFTRFKNTIQMHGLKLTNSKNYNYFIIEFYSNDKHEATIYARKEENSTFYEMTLKLK